jgi:peptide/nickel transport system substrate-binding protein
VSWFAGYADPAMTPVRWNPDITGWNKPWVRSHAELNELLDKSLATAPGAERSTVLSDVCRRIAQDANIIPLVTKDMIVAHRADRISPATLRVEGYALPLRRLAEFTVR